MVVENDYADYIEKMYERSFGEGSWVELEKEVRSRHPEFFRLYDAMEDDEIQQERIKWWQIWRRR